MQNFIEVKARYYWIYLGRYIRFTSVWICILAYRWGKTLHPNYIYVDFIEKMLYTHAPDFKLGFCSLKTLQRRVACSCLALNGSDVKSERVYLLRGRACSLLCNV